jgi:hypothetical protein
VEARLEEEEEEETGGGWICVAEAEICAVEWPIVSGLGGVKCRCWLMLLLVVEEGALIQCLCQDFSVRGSPALAIPMVTMMVKQGPQASKRAGQPA